MAVTEDDAYEPSLAELRWIHETEETVGWQFVRLDNPELNKPPEPPAIHGLLYGRLRHVISGPPESAKTLVAYVLLLEAIRNGSIVAILDFEMGAYAAKRMLIDLGATDDELASILYAEPDGPPTPNDLGRIKGEFTEYVLIDAGAGAYDTTGLDDNARKDVERFARIWTRPLWKAGIATILVDHVTKNADTRGKFAIGSERKLGGADVHLGFESIKTLTRGTTGVIKVTVHKDRPGFLTRPTACYVDLQSDPDTHRIAWQLRPPDQPDETGSLRPTIYMERISQYLERQTEPVSRNTIEQEVKGVAAEWKRKAIDTLIREGYATEEIGSRGARLVTTTRPYRQATDPKTTTSSDLVPTSSRRSDLTSSDDVPPQGASTRSTPSDETTSSTDEDEVNVYDPDIQALLDNQPDDIPF